MNTAERKTLPTTKEQSKSALIMSTGAPKVQGRLERTPLPADDNGVIRYEERFVVDALGAEERHLPALERELEDRSDKRKGDALLRLLMHKPKKGVAGTAIQPFIADVLSDVHQFSAMATERACQDIRRLRPYPSFPESEELVRYCDEWERAIKAARDLIYSRRQDQALLDSGYGVPENRREAIEARTRDPRIFLWLKKCRWAEDETSLTIICDSKFTKTWVETNYLSQLQAVAAGKAVSITVKGEKP